MTIDYIRKAMIDGHVRGLAAYLDEDDSASSASTCTNSDEAEFILGLLVIQVANFSGKSVRKVIARLTYAAHLLDAHKNQINIHQAKDEYHE